MTTKSASVCVLMGGRSAEREVSLSSGRQVLDALLRQGVDAYAIDVQDPIDTLKQLDKDRPACVFPMLHGPEGEDGTLQGVLEILRLPYVGCGVLSSALSMDKVRCKWLWRSIGLPVTDTVVMTRAERQAVEHLGLPLCVKPVYDGSSYGITRVNAWTELEVAYELAAQYGEVMAEPWIEGEEYTVGVVGDRVMPSVRIRPAVEFYDFAAKYTRDDTQYDCPAGLSVDEERYVQAISLKALQALNYRHWSRVDLLRNKAGEFFLMETNPVPGMTPSSLLPKAAKVMGMDFDALVMAVLAQVVEASVPV